MAIPILLKKEEVYAAYRCADINGMFKGAGS
jgi:hypothetical protein